MVGSISIFSESNGFVIYEPQLLKEYLMKKELYDNNVLNHFTKTNHGDIIAENGIAIPLTGIDDGYYNFSIGENKKERIITESKAKIHSKGWILNIVSAKIYIIGIGYFCDVNKINENNALKFNLKNGWYEV
jgi:hypothetical protein